MIDKHNLTGIILAGGKSSRMGTDKGFLELNKKQFVQYSIDALTPLVSKIIIVTDHEAYHKFGLQCVKDGIKNAGPVAGIVAGLQASKTTYNIVLSCDIPLINTNILKKLIVNTDQNTTILQVESHGKSMPLIALYNKQVLPIFKTQLKSGERRLRLVVNQCKPKNILLDSSDTCTTRNVNTKNDFKDLINAH